MQNTVKLIKSSRALQIIQSRLAYKQQLYSEALLKSNSVNISAESAVKNSESNSEVASSKIDNHGYLSDEDNESFVSADSVNQVLI